DVLFVNAGVAPMAPFAEQSVEAFDTMFHINVRGLYFLVQKALPLLGDGASVLLNASVVHKYGFPGASAYAATKAAVRSIGQTLAAELAPRGVRVNLLSPGPIESPLWAKTGMPREAMDGFGQAVGGRTPLGRFGKPEEMAAAAAFLASDEAAYLTGSDLQADGGLTQAF
ncbi:MAG: SDR family oxidoreductase, partial [Planctomycetota bacterium]